MRESNVDTSRIPKFNSFDESREYFDKLGKLQYFGWEGNKDGYYVYTLDTSDGRKFSLDLFNDGRYVLILRPYRGDF